MKASETTLQPIIEGAKQYIIPLFQRSYSWEKKDWQVLCEDLADLCEADKPRSHFIGSIVTMPTTSVPEGVPKYLLIDGQQRLTTIFILLTLLRDRANRSGQLELAEEIDKTLLVNPYKKGDDYYKIMPTHIDDNRTSFQALIKAAGLAANDKIGAAYTFFERRLHQSKVDGQLLKKVITENLSVVSIVLDRDDNPYLVFESLNATGRPLTQADLIRNFFFLKIHTDLQQEMHARYWEPMQGTLGDRLTEFIRHYLMKDGTVIKSDYVYFTLKERLGQGDALSLLQDLSRSADHYKRLLVPAREPDPGLRDALARLNRLEVTTAYPFLLCCYDEFERGELSAADFRDIVSFIENFVIRRFVCNIPTNQLNKIFAPLYNQIKNGGYASLLDGLRQILPNRGYPKDVEFKSRLMDSKLYGQGDRLAKTRLILECIERSFGHKEPVAFDGLNIEHVMPQTLTEAWRAHLGDNWEATHELLLHTLGNLTLTGYNPELSNEDFLRKRELLRQSSLQLNKYFENVPDWREEEIEARAATLAEIAASIWPYLGGEQVESEPDAVAKEKPKTLTFLGQVYPVDSWRDVLETTLNVIGDRDPEHLDAIAAQMPRLLGPDRARYKDSRKINNGKFVNVNLSAKAIRRFCIRVLEVADLEPGDWVVETV